MERLFDTFFWCVEAGWLTININPKYDSERVDLTSYRISVILLLIIIYYRGILMLILVVVQEVLVLVLIVPVVLRYIFAIAPFGGTRSNLLGIADRVWRKMH